MKIRFFYFLLFLGLGFVFACTAKRPPRIALPPADQQKIIKQVAHTIHSLQGMRGARGFAKVSLRIKGHQARFDAVVKIEFPLSFYFETLDDFANTRYQLISDGAQLFWQDFSKKEYWEGALHEKMMQKFLPLASHLEETLGLWIGKIPPLKLQEAEVWEGPLPFQYLIVIPQGKIIWEDSSKTIVYLALKTEGAKFGYEYEGSDFHPITFIPTKETDVKVPFRIRLKDAKTKNEIEIHYQSLEVGMGKGFLPFSTEFNPLPDAKKIHALP